MNFICSIAFQICFQPPESDCVDHIGKLGLAARVGHLLSSPYSQCTSSATHRKSFFTFKIAKFKLLACDVELKDFLPADTFAQQQVKLRMKRSAFEEKKFAFDIKVW